MKTLTHTCTCSVVLELAGYLGRLQTCPIFLPYTPSTGIAGMCHCVQPDKRFWWLFSILEKRTTTKYLFSSTLLLCVWVCWVMVVSSCCCWDIRFSSCECDPSLMTFLNFTLKQPFKILLEDRFKYIDDINIVLALGILYLFDLSLPALQRSTVAHRQVALVF